MKSFSVLQLLTVVTVTMMICTAKPAPTKLKLQLMLIRQEAKTVLKHVPSKTPVTMIPKQRNRCERFFCFAEEVLKLTPADKLHHHYAGLTLALKMFNQENKTTNCHLSKNHTCEIKPFLNDVIDCVDYALGKMEIKTF